MIKAAKGDIATPIEVKDESVNVNEFTVNCVQFRKFPGSVGGCLAHPREQVQEIPR